MTIRSNFKVPKSLHHQWVLFDCDQAVMLIYGIPGRKDVVQEHLRPTITLPESMALDWIQESVEHLRLLCEQP